MHSAFVEDLRAGTCTRIDASGAVLHLGREADNDIVLDDPAVSRHHAKLTRTGERWLLHDLHSRNGTLLGEDRVIKDRVLKPGEPFTIARYEIRVVPAAADPVSAAADPVSAAANPVSAAANPISAAANPVSAAANPVSAAADPVSAAAEPGNDGVPGHDLARLRLEIHRDLLEDMKLKRLDLIQTSDAEFRSRVHETVRTIVRDKCPSLPAEPDQERLVREVLNETLGLGPLEDLMADPTISEIMVNGASTVYIERAGRLERAPCRFISDQHVMAVIERIVAPLGRRVDESTPMVDARLKDGSRVNVIIPPLAINGPTLTIRRFACAPLTAADLIAAGTMDTSMATFLEQAVISRRNIVISGGTGTGKTTLLNVLSTYLPDDERIVTIEDAAELHLSQQHVVQLEGRQPNLEGNGAITIRDLVRNALRMRPNRIVVGECRGAEALDMLQAMNTGHDGSLTTVHANSPRDALSRLETMILMSGVDVPLHAIREQIASSIHVIVHLARMEDGSRKITQISEVREMRDTAIALADVFFFKYPEAGNGDSGFVTAAPDAGPSRSGISGTRQAMRPGGARQRPAR